ncbi:plasmid pRiA4b ORF-3 family protein [Horticoccus luteus]|uniref:Plasmid pRiA4b ORF-3 family protein n=1 Tax=Horticoccus luteus TaxID=2862869 RepID=A0A8F9TUQ4_9BACT|nr:plasmid pRiA4b ORF-3 family protein [Horticoccus luteus]QYM78470.1 plasmid pRiA4b ORF-3 family protein [Horticoccus luteus]
MIGLHEGRGAKAKKVRERTFTLRLSVAGTEPSIWRRLVVRESMWLSGLHDAIQVALEWFDYQTHVFQFDDLRFGNPVKRDDLLVEDDRDVTLGEAGLDQRERFRYCYHFGEGWSVDLVVEKIGEMEKGVRYPLCTAGERAGPPEDCGGLEAFHDLLKSLAEPDTELGREWREWVGPDYDPSVCNLDRINQGLRKLRQT